MKSNSDQKKIKDKIDKKEKKKKNKKSEPENESIKKDEE